jgi:hypothetical protein
MGNFARNLLQYCTYWEQTDTDTYGKPVFAAPVRLPCRWEDISEHVIDKHGHEIVSKSRIFTSVQPRPEGYMRLTAANDANWASVDPLDTTKGAFEIRQVKTIPNLRNPLNVLHTTWL